MTYLDAMAASQAGEQWFMENEWTSDQRETWKAWFLKEMVARKIAPTKRMAEYEFSMFDFSYGPRIIISEKNES